MKNLKINLTLLTALAFLCLTTNELKAQIKVIDNNVGIGIDNPIYKLQVNGKLKIERGETDMVIDSRGQGSGGGEPTLRPTQKDYGFIGTADRYFFKTYTRDIYRKNEFTLSDKRVKTNIQSLNNPLEKLTALNGYSFQLNQENHPFASAKTAKKGERQMGFMAQELQEVFPDMVEYDEELGYLVVKNYEQLFPVIVEALKAQQKQIDALKKLTDHSKSSE